MSILREEAGYKMAKDERLVNRNIRARKLAEGYRDGQLCCMEHKSIPKQILKIVLVW